MSKVKITPLQQDCDFSCGVACVAMVADLSLQYVKSKLSHPIKNGLTPHDMDDLLYKCGVAFQRLMLPELSRTMPHIITVPSLNVVGGTHYIVADLSDAVLTVYDPQRGREGKKYYAENYASEGQQLTSYSEVIRIY